MRFGLSIGADSSGFLFQVAEQQGNRRRVTTVDGFGRPIAVRDEDTESGEVRALDRRFDSSGRLTFESIPYFDGNDADGVEYSYDALGRVTLEVTTADDSRLSYCYASDCLPPGYISAYGNLTNGYVRQDQNGSPMVVQLTAYGDPDNALVARVTEDYSAPADLPRYRSTAIERDANGRPVRVSRDSPTGMLAERWFEYDGPRLAVEVHPETGSTQYGYDERGNRVEVRTPVRTIRRRFDWQGRVVAIDYDGDAHDVSLAYDAVGNLIRASNPASEWSYSYDAAGRLSSEELRIDDQSMHFGYVYNTAGQRQASAYPSGEVVDYSPNSFGEPLRAGEVIDIASRHANGALSELRYANGVIAQFSQNARLWPSARTFTKADGQLLEGYSYVYDGVGNMTGIQNLRLPERSLSAVYDGVDRLVSVDSYWGEGAIRYDGLDNILHKQIGNHHLGYSYDTVSNRLVAVDAGPALTFPINHDAEGKMLGSGFYSYEYNAAGQLSGVPELPSLRFRYDAHGRRVAIDDIDGTEYRVYDRAGALVYLDSCSE